MIIRHQWWLVGWYWNYSRGSTSQCGNNVFTVHWARGDNFPANWTGREPWWSCAVHNWIDNKSGNCVSCVERENIINFWKSTRRLHFAKFHRPRLTFLCCLPGNILINPGILYWHLCPTIPHIHKHADELHSARIYGIKIKPKNELKCGRAGNEPKRLSMETLGHRRMQTPSPIQWWLG